MLLLFSKSFVPSHPSRVEKFYFAVFMSKKFILYLVTIASFIPNSAEVKVAAHPRTDFVPKLTKFCINNARVFLELPRRQLIAKFDISFSEQKYLLKNQFKYFGSIMYILFNSLEQELLDFL